MLFYPAVFLLIALNAAVYGYGGPPAGAVGIAETIFVVFMALSVVSLVWGLITRRR